MGLEQGQGSRRVLKLGGFWGFKSVAFVKSYNIMGKLYFCWIKKASTRALYQSEDKF